MNGLTRRFERIVGSILWTLTKVDKLILWRLGVVEKQVMALIDSVAQLERAQSKLDQDVENVKGVVGGLKQNVDDLTAIVNDLKGQVASPEVLARLDAVAADLATKDTELDAVAPDPVETPPVPEPAPATLSASKQAASKNK